MTATMQPSLFDNGDLGVSLADLDGTVQRRILTAGAWVDHRPAWLTGSEAVFDNLEATVPWRSERRQMYDRVVDVPRLVCFYAENQPTAGRTSHRSQRRAEQSLLRRTR